MKKIGKKMSKEENLTEELELAQALKEIEADEELRDLTVPETVTQGLYAQIAAYEEAKRDMDSQETTQEIIKEAQGQPLQMKQSAEVAVSQETELSIEERFPDMTPEEREIFQAGLEAKKKVRRFKKKPKKIYFLIAAVLVMTLAMGTVGVGEKFKWLEVGELEVGSNKTIAVESEEDIVREENVDEIAAYETAEVVLGVPVVMLRMAGEGWRFESIQLYEDNFGVILLYSYEDAIVQYSMVQNANSLSHNEILTGMFLEAYEIEVDGESIVIESYLEPDGKITLKGTFSCNNVYYSLKSAIEQEVFEEILKNIYFF